MSKGNYTHIRNMLLALGATFGAVIAFIMILPYLIYAIMLLVAAYIAYQIGSYVFALALLKLATLRS